MNRPFLACALLLATATACMAFASMGLDAPEDDQTVKLAMHNDPATAKEITEGRVRWQALEDQLTKLPEERLKTLFPAAEFPKSTKKLKKFAIVASQIPEGYILPIVHPSGVNFTSMGYKGRGESYFLTIGDTAGILVYPNGDQQHISAVVIYLKSDPQFIPLKAATDYPARRKWEQDRLAILEKLVEDALKK